MRRKELLAAGLIRDIKFWTVNDEALYIAELENRYIDYEILDRHVRGDGSVIIRLLIQYDNVPLIEL